MKSRKFKAVLAAVSAIAVLATAMTGFAGLSTATIYNIAGNTTKVSVVSTVDGLTEGDQVTYLVETVEDAGVGGSGIAYIDQKEADSTGKAVFEYQMDKDALSDATKATVITGNDNAEVNGESGVLGVAAIEATSGTGYTVTYSAAIAGTETINVTVAATKGYEVTEVVVGDNTYNAPGTYTVDVVNGVPETVTVTAVAQEVAVDNTFTKVDASEDYKPEGSDVTHKKHSTIFKVTGNFSVDTHNFGVTHDGVEYPAVHHPANQEYVIVQLITDSGVVVDAQPYCRAK